MYLSKLNSSRKLHRIFLGGVIMSSNNPIDTSILPAFRPEVPAQASLMLNPKYQVMEVQSRTRSYESPKILATHFIIEQGFAQSGNLKIQSFSYDTTEGEDLSF